MQERLRNRFLRICGIGYVSQGLIYNDLDKLGEKIDDKTINVGVSFPHNLRRRPNVAAGSQIVLAGANYELRAERLQGLNMDTEISLEAPRNADGKPVIPGFTDEPSTHTPSVVISKLTGANALTDTVSRWKAEGTDLGIMWRGHQETVLAAFGDTFGEWCGDGGGGEVWRSNVLLRSPNIDPSDGIRFDSASEGSDGVARELIPSRKESGSEITTIPTAAIAVGDRQYMAFMSVKEWGEPGLWRTNYSRIAYSDDLGETWNYEDGPTWQNTANWDHPFQMVAFAQQDPGTIYMFGTPSGRAGTLHLARVPSEKVLDRGAYEYWAGSEWALNDDSAATPLFQESVAELGVIYNFTLKRWVMIYLQALHDDDMVVRTAQTPTGPWSQPKVVASHADHPIPYGGFIHPASAEGNDIYYSLSEWRTYSVYLMRVTLDSGARIVRPNLVQDTSFERQAGTTVVAPWRSTHGTAIERMGDGNTQFSGITNARLTEKGSEISQRIRVKPGTRYEAAAFLSTPHGGSGEFGVRGCDGVTLAATATTCAEGYERLCMEVDSGEHTWLEIYARSTSRWPVLVDAVSLAERD